MTSKLTHSTFAGLVTALCYVAVLLLPAALLWYAVHSLETAAGVLDKL